MASRSFGSQRPYRAHLLRGGGLGKEMEDLRDDIDEGFSALEAETNPITESVSVFVAQAGSDTTGDGTESRPYATVTRALRDRKPLAAPGIAFRVQVVAPYTGPGFSFESLLPTVEVTSASTTSRPPVICVESHFDAELAGVSDPRFVVEVGPITASAASVVNTMFIAYTVPTGSFTDAHIGKVVRVFRAGAEVGRGTLAHIITGGSDVVYLSQVRSSGPSAAWAPAASDLLYACEHTVVFNSPVRISAGERTWFLLAGCKVEVLGSAFGAEYGITLLSGISILANVRVLNTSANRDEGLYIHQGAQATISYVPSTVASWMDATERTFVFMAGGYVDGGAAVTDYGTVIRGRCALSGWVFNQKTAVLGRGSISTGGMWFRGQLLIGAGGQLDPESPCVFGGNRASPYAQVPLYLEGCIIGNEHGYVINFMVDTLGYASGLSMCIVKKATFTSQLSFSGIAGSATITAPVIRADDFANVVTAAGNITNSTLGQDVQAGTTYAAFAGLPITDATTLTRIATT